MLREEPIVPSDNLAAKPKRSQRARLEDSFLCVMTDDTMKLMDTQTKLQTHLGIKHIIGSSLVETLHKLLHYSHYDGNGVVCAIMLGEEYGIAPTQFWYGALQEWSRSAQWEALLQMAEITPPPFGFQPLVQALLEQDRGDLALKLMLSIQDSEEQEACRALITEHANAKQVP